MLSQYTQHYSQQAKRFWQTYPDTPNWMQRVRLAGLTKFESLGLPTTKNENYKYTNFEKLLADNYQIRSSSNQYEQKVDSPVQGHTLVMVNGKIASHDLPSDKVTIQDVKKMDNDFAESLLSETQDLLKNDPLFQLNESLFHSGVLISFKKDLDRPIHLINILDEELQGSCHGQHNFFICEESVHVHLIEEFQSNENSEIFNNHCSTIIVRKNASFHHTVSNKQDSTNLFAHNQRVLVNRDGHYENVNLNLGSSTSRYNLHLALTEEGAHASAHGLYALKGEQHCDVASYIHHIAPHTTSDQLYKGILNDHSRGVFTGMVRVEKDAQKIDAKQLNRSLLLSKRSHSNARPQLEIYADDVKCSHGHTTGQIQDDELFYFESRGISKQKAKEMLARAFSYEVLLKINNINIRNYLQDELIKQYGSISY